MYNMFKEESEVEDILLGMLKLKRDDFGRYRDCYLSPEGDKIIVYTRTGGNNREDYFNEDLTDHPMYLCDYDDDFDNTYMSIEFSVPASFQVICKNLVNETDTRTGSEKFQDFLKELESDPDKVIKENKNVSNFVENFKSIFETNGGDKNE